MAFMVEVSGANVPVPSVVHPAPAETVNPPLRETTALFAQTVWSAPALATGEVENETIIVSETGLHVPLFVEVKIIVTLPPEISAALGVYVVLSSELSAKVTVPSVVHNPEFVLEVPINVTFELFEQTVWSVPAFTIGLSIYVMVMLSSSARHCPFPVDVRIKITEPAVVSAELAL